MNKVFFNLEQSAAFTGHRKVPYGKQREVELKLNKILLSAKTFLLLFMICICGCE